jgi:hypothetical protein
MPLGQDGPVAPEEVRPAAVVLSAAAFERVVVQSAAVFVERAAAQSAALEEEAVPLSHHRDQCWGVP